MEGNSPRKNPTKLKAVKKKIKRLIFKPKQVLNKYIKHPYSNRVGKRAEMMRQVYRAKIYVKEERAKLTTRI